VNALANRDVSIVTAIEGTTRDLVEVELDMAGVPVTLIDSAGLRESVDIIEQEGIRRALERARSADLRIWVCDVSAGGDHDLTDHLIDSPYFRVWNKIDRVSDTNAVASEDEAYVSCRTGDGLDQLWKALSVKAKSLAGLRAGSELSMTNARHRHLLETAFDALENLVREGDLPDHGLCADQLRICAKALGQISGAVAYEDVLNAIFSRFCIGK
jgi:tRNA modification GTPase